MVTYKGTVRNGSVVLEESVALPDGAEVQVALAEDATSEPRPIWEALRDLPPDASFEDMIEQVYVLYKIERGVRQLDAGQGIPHEEACRRFSEWLE